MPLSAERALWITLCVFLGIAFLFWFFYAPIRSLRLSRHPDHVFYRTVNKIAKEGDYYLINRFDVGYAGKNVHVDHIIFGDHYIYLIRDRYFKGAMLASPNDQSWVRFTSKKQKKNIDNPLLKNKERADILAYMTQMDRAFFVPIVLINDDCFVNGFSNAGASSFLVSESQLPKFIEKYENSGVAPFSGEELQRAVMMFAGLKESHPAP